MSVATATKPAAKKATRAAKQQTNEQKLDEAFGPHWRELAWRLDNLYHIVDEQAKVVPFRMNEEQAEFIDNIHNRNIIVKARQLGFSTLIQVLQADQALFNANHNGVTISDTLPNASKLFAKVEKALEQLPPELAAMFPIKSEESKTSISFEHGSAIYISTSSRGGTVQLLHVSELGKISRRHPERAKEIVSGAFESVPRDGCIVVESTTEGAFGELYDLVDPALKRQQANAPETSMDWRVHFFAWYRKKAFSLPPEEAVLVAIPDRLALYFRKHEAELGITLTAGQKAWYVKKEEEKGARVMKREYPTTIQEAFEQAVEGAIFGEEMTRVREQGRITVVPIDPDYQMNTFWDFGTGNRTVVWCMQQVLLQKRWVKYEAADGTGFGPIWRKLEEWRRANGSFQWGTHHLPHDADTQRLGEGVDTYKGILQKLGMGVESGAIVVVPRVLDKQIGIELMHTSLGANDNWFDRDACAEGIKCLDGYQYVWDEKRVAWSREPFGNWASHGTDAWMQHAQGYIPPMTGAQQRSLRNFHNRPRRGF